MSGQVSSSRAAPQFIHSSVQSRDTQRLSVSHVTFDKNSPSLQLQDLDPPAQSSSNGSPGSAFRTRYQHVGPKINQPIRLQEGSVRSGPSQLKRRYSSSGGCLDSFHSPLCSGLARFVSVRSGSAVLQLQAWHPLVPAAALLAEAADVLQGLTLQRLHRRVLQRQRTARHTPGNTYLFI